MAITRGCATGITAALACVLLLLATVLGCGAPDTRQEAPAPRWPAEVADRASGADAYGHLRALARIAEENGGNRASPGPGYAASVDYVAGVLRAAGYEVSTPSYPQASDDEYAGTGFRNVIAQTRTGDPDHVVMAGAHLDSVEDGPGINDNGSGVATLLAIATELGGSPPVRNAIRFAFWGSEEDALQGSRNYLRGLSAQQRDSIMLYLNLDMTASPNGGYFVQGGVGDRSEESGPRGSAAVAKTFSEWLARTGVPAEAMEFDSASDYVPFVNADIPSGGVLTGDSGEKTSAQATQWGGTAGADFDQCYHSACDGLANINQVALDRITHAVAGTLAQFAVSEEHLRG